MGHCPLFPCYFFCSCEHCSLWLLTMESEPGLQKKNVLILTLKQVFVHCFSGEPIFYKSPYLLKLIFISSEASTLMCKIFKDSTYNVQYKQSVYCRCISMKVRFLIFLKIILLLSPNWKLMTLLPSRKWERWCWWRASTLIAGPKTVLSIQHLHLKNSAVVSGYPSY